MLLSKPLQAFVENSPVSVMVAAIVERLYDSTALETVFQDNAVLQKRHFPLVRRVFEMPPTAKGFQILHPIGKDELALEENLKASRRSRNRGGHGFFADRV